MGCMPIKTYSYNEAQSTFGWLCARPMRLASVGQCELASPLFRLAKPKQAGLLQVSLPIWQGDHRPTATTNSSSVLSSTPHSAGRQAETKRAHLP